MLRDRFTVVLLMALGSGLLLGCELFPSVGDAVPPGRPPTLALFPAASPPAPVASLRNGRGDETFFFVDRDPRTGRDRLAQALSRSRSGPTIRAHLGGQGEVVRVDNETSGEVAIFAWSERRVVVQLFDRDGRFAGGYAVLENPDGTLALARLVGAPAFEGQIVGHASGGIVGAFALKPTDAELAIGPPVPLPPRAQALFDGTVRRFAARPIPGADDPIVSTVDAVTGQWANTFAGWTMSNRGKLAAGVVVGAALIATGAAPLIGLAIGGGSMAALIGSYCFETARRHIDAVRDEAGLAPLDDGASPGIDAWRDHLADRWQAGVDLVDAARDGIRDVLDGAGLPREERPPAPAVVQEAEPDAVHQDPAASVPKGDLPATDTPVDGLFLDVDGTAVPLDGTVDVAGRLSVTGSDAANRIAIDGSITGDGAMTGTIADARQRRGSVAGGVEGFGSCMTQQSSGGQGAFTFAYAMGATGGVVRFDYDAYSVPDRFDLFTVTGGVKRQLYTTTGLVSGSGSGAFPVDAGAIVFVGVSAPIDGTAWDFTLGCPQ